LDENGLCTVPRNASRELAGLVSDFHGARWALFASMLGDAADKNVTFNQTAFDVACFATIEQPFVSGGQAYPNQNTSCTLKLSVLVCCFPAFQTSIRLAQM
jgi:Alpha-N-acetylglucosaminidase (NAGLU) C-terminal domain